MTPTREQLDALIAKWRERTRAPIQAESLAWHTAADELAACLAAPEPKPQVIINCKVFPDESGLEPFRAPAQAMPPIEAGDWLKFDGDWTGPWEARGPSETAPGRVVEIRKANGTVWTREPRR